ncbi:ribosome recycling factor [Listeria monocytogenes]|nr:ribosome recycling factor [Listeria monocytogenes]
MNVFTIRTQIIFCDVASFFLVFFNSSLASRRMLRTATFASSASFFTSLTNSLRRSSVNCGIDKRSTEPSLFGVKPKSDFKIAFSISPKIVLS